MKFNEYNVILYLFEVIIQHLEELGTDQWPVLPGNRSLRCTGVALSVAAGLLAACVSGTGGRIVALVGGPCTEGHGSVSTITLPFRVVMILVKPIT